VLELINTPLDWLGGIILALSLIFLEVLAWEKGIGWRLGTIVFFPLGFLVFVLFHWKEANYWFFGSIIGLTLILAF
jgi:hypothetical protein